jgi:putative peptidoglycan lipid II flippase
VLAPEGTPPHDALNRNAGAVSLGILLSRVAGLLREKLLAYHLGTGLAAEAFRAALRIPNVLQNLLGDGVVSAAFVPTYARAVDRGEIEDAGRLAGAVASLLILMTGALVAIGILFAGPITRVLTPGFPVDSPKFALTVTLVRIITPSLGFLVLSAWCLGVLNAHRNFFRAYVAPVLWNASIIVAVSVAALVGREQRELAVAVAIGALVGAVLQFALQLPTVLRLAPGLRRGVSRSTPGLRQVLRASGPAILGRGVVQLSAYVDLIVASLLAAGAVAALGYAQVLYLLPVSLFGMSVAAASLPSLSTIDATEIAARRMAIDRAAGRISLFVVPTSVLYLAMGDKVVALLFEGGAFGSAQTRQVAAVLAAYALGLLATTQSRLLQAVLYALDDTRTPARVAALRVLVATTLGVLLMLLLDAWRWDADGPVRVASFGLASLEARSAEASLLRLGAVGLALGSSLGAWTEWAILSRKVRRRTGFRPARGHLLRVLLAALAIVPGGLVGRSVSATVAAALPGVPSAVLAALALVIALGSFVLAATLLGLAQDLRLPRRRVRTRGVR